MPNNKVKILDIEFDQRLINLIMVSKSSGLSYTYTRELLIGKKKNPKALWKLRNTIVKLYGSLIKYIPYDLKLNSKEAA